MKPSSLVFEQTGSLVDRLASAGIEHGDMAEVTLSSVGVHSRGTGVLGLAFCPSEITRVKILKRGTRRERAQPIPEDVRMSKNLLHRVLKGAPLNGFIQLRVIVHSNGHIQLNGSMKCPEPAPEDVQVQWVSSYQDFQARQVATVS